ncbi:MAG TPA: outer membrane protein assembly factor, partial [Flavobacteriaceae bacterium]|nr:outer membrane protein assembly factor [Flavobacteriaceae bacterium]
MNSKHFFKYFQKYHIFLSFAILVWFLYACNSTKKVPNGEYLLTKNNFEYVDRKDFDEEIPNFVSQKPNKKDLYLFPTRLWIYNMANAKYDSILNEYQT